MNELDCLKDVIDRTITTLQDVKDYGVKRQYSFELNTSDFEEYLSMNILKQGRYIELFKELEYMPGPVLYWFEILSDGGREELVRRFENYKLNENKGDKFRNMPAVRKHPDFNSNILYVGKVKVNYHGRLIQHMGFFKNKDTQGLQLYHWTKEFPLKLRVHLMEFKKDMADMMGVIELAFARHLKPLIGKHK